jgi:hypothetical protein
MGIVLHLLLVLIGRLMAATSRVDRVLRRCISGLRGGVQ